MRQREGRAWNLNCVVIGEVTDQGACRGGLAGADAAPDQPVPRLAFAADGEARQEAETSAGLSDFRLGGLRERLPGVAWVGGVGMGVEWDEGTSGVPPWRETHFKAEGPVVAHRPFLVLMMRAVRLSRCRQR